MTKFTLTQKVALALGVLVLGLLLTGAVLLRSLLASDKSMGVVVASIAPAVAVAYEMDVAVGETALRVVSFVQSRSPEYRSGALLAISDFKVYLARYTTMVSSADERELAEKLQAQFREFEAMGAKLVGLTDTHAQEFRALQDGLRNFGAILETQFMSLVEQPTTADYAKLRAAHRLEALLAELSLELHIRPLTGTEPRANLAREKLMELGHALNELLPRMNTASELPVRNSLSSAWGALERQIEQELRYQADAEQDMKKFMDLRRSLDDNINSSLQDKGVDRLDKALESARSAQATAFAWLAGAALLSIAGALAAFLWISGAVRTTLRSLSVGTEKVAEGQLNVRLASSGDPDFDRVLGDFNSMAERLQATTVSKLQLEESDERFTHAVRGSLAGIWDWNVRTGSFYMSPRFMEIFGYGDDPQRVNRAFFVEHLHPDDKERLEAARTAHFEQRIRFDIEYRIRRGDGQMLWVRDIGQAVWNDAGEVIRFSGSISDIDAQKMAEARIERMAYYDALTDLPGRALFNDRLGQAIKNAERQQRLVAVLFVDLDRFKSINDNLGHQFGDMMLQQAAARMLQCVRRGDTVGRFSGDEFGAVLADMGARDDVEKVVASFVASFGRPYVLDGKECFVTPSIGVAVYPDDEHTAPGLLRAADTAMYRAKAQGGNGFQFFSEDMRGAWQDRMAMENDLHRALERGEFMLHYQPVVDAEGRIRGVEALMRWQHPHKGLVSPAQFIPLAEETGLIIPIGEWVFRTACTQMSQWKALGHAHLTLAVNVSPRQLRQTDFAGAVSKVLASTGMDGQRVELEITEGMLATDEASGLALRAISDIGVQLSVDDFGTGYSSLTYLKRFPISTLKIDQFFVRGLPQSSEDAAIVVAIIAMARSLGLRLIAEGVETAAQLEFLRSHGCEAYQGYHFSKPVPAGQLSDFLARGGRLGQSADEAR